MVDEPSSVSLKFYYVILTVALVYFSKTLVFINMVV